MRLRSRPSKGLLRAEFIFKASWIGDKYSLNPHTRESALGTVVNEELKRG